MGRGTVRSLVPTDGVCNPGGRIVAVLTSSIVSIATLVCRLTTANEGRRHRANSSSRSTLFNGHHRLLLLLRSRLHATLLDSTPSLPATACLAIMRDMAMPRLGTTAEESLAWANLA